MADVMLRASNPSITCVSNIFIDEYMADANGEYIKIYLYLLRHFGGDARSMSTDVMADALDHTQRDIIRGLKYWEKKGLLRLEYDKEGELIAICLVNPAGQQARTAVVPTPEQTSAFAAYDSASDEMKELTQSPVEKPKAAPMPQAPNVTAIPKKHAYSQEDVERLTGQEAVQELIFVAQTYMGHSLTTNDINTIFYWYDDLAFSSDLIIYLMEYCVDRGHQSIYYMDKVALGWAEQGITSVEEAQKETGLHSESVHTIMKAFGISNRSLVQEELNFIDKWTGEYGFTLDIISDACNRTIRNISRPSFEYADRILTSWHQNGVTGMSDVNALDEKRKAAAQKSRSSEMPAAKKTAFHNFEERQYDMDAMERMLLNKHKNAQ